MFLVFNKRQKILEVTTRYWYSTTDILNLLEGSDMFVNNHSSEKYICKAEQMKFLGQSLEIEFP